MKKTLKRIISGMLTLTVALSAFSVSGFAASAKIQSNVSVYAVTSNLSQGSLPQAAGTLKTGTTYNFNISATSDNYIKKYELYLRRPGESSFSRVYSLTANNYMRYTSYATSFSTAGTGQYYWTGVYRGSSTVNKYKVNTFTVTSSGNSGNSGSWDSKLGKTLANINGSAYTTNNLSYRGGYKGQCTWYAYGRFLEVNGIALKTARHAKYWLSDNSSDSRVRVVYSIQDKSIAVSKNGSYGHVMFIEHVEYSNGSPSVVYYTECNAYPSSNGVYNAGVDCILKKLSYSQFVSQKTPAGYIVKA
jgi:surface antigen